MERQIRQTYAREGEGEGEGEGERHINGRCRIMERKTGQTSCQQDKTEQQQQQQQQQKIANNQKHQWLL